MINAGWYKINSSDERLESSKNPKNLKIAYNDSQLHGLVLPRKSMVSHIVMHTMPYRSVPPPAFDRIGHQRHKDQAGSSPDVALIGPWEGITGKVQNPRYVKQLGLLICAHEMGQGGTPITRWARPRDQPSALCPT